MPRATHVRPSLAVDGWVLVWAEERHAASPATFHIPPRATRDTLVRGVAAKLLFHIETKDADRVVDRGIDRMWVIVMTVTPEGYLGVLDNDPGYAEGLNLRAGDIIAFGPQHVAAIEQPPMDYLVRKYGDVFLDNE